MENKIRRPRSIWVTQIVLTLTAIFVLLFMVYGALMSVSEGKPPPLADFLSYMIPLGMLAVLEILSVLFLAFRKSVGRWLACVALIVQALFLISGVIPFQNDWRDVLATVVGIGVLPFSLTFSLIFSKKVSKFFARVADDQSGVVLPPPPPSFDA